MDPHTGKIYSLDDPNIPPEVLERLVPVEGTPEEIARQAKYYEELAELKDMKETYDALRKQNEREERTRVVPNRAERRAASRNSRQAARKIQHG